jgi:PAS domain S-box-containing protein
MDLSGPARTEPAAARRGSSETRAWIEALLELMPTPVILVDPGTGDATWANSAADRLAGGRFPLGGDRFGDGGSGFVPRDAATGRPLRREQSASYTAAATGRRVEGFHFDFDTPSGQRSLVASADLLPPIGDMGQAVIASFEDVTDLRRAQRTSDDAIALLDALFASAPIGLAYFDRDLRFVRVNDALAAMNGVPAARHIGHTLAEVVPDIDPAVMAAFRRVIETGEPMANLEVEAETPANPGVKGTWLEGFYPVTGGDGQVIGMGAVVLNITARKAAEAAVERALGAEREARAAAEAAAARARFLAEASVLLDRSLDYGETLRSLAELAVPDVADYCAIDLIEDGALRNVAVGHVDPGKAAFAERLLRRFSYPPDAPNGPPEVVRSGRSELLAEVTDAMVVANSRSPEHLAMLRELGMRSVMVVPMISRSRMLGTLTLIGSESGRTFGDADVLLAEDLARRAAVAIDNARLYSERAHIARTLQDSLLPPELPRIPGVEVAARYVAAGEGIDVGGDFYDVFDLGGGGGWSVVIGDVCGKGPDAAALTALARYTLRATADQAALPSQALRLLNDAVLRQRGDGRFITVAYARIAPHESGDGLRLTLSTGGHPQPIVLRADGSAAPVGRAGTLLGVVPDVDLSDEAIELHAGDALFLYTDGVTEAHAPAHIMDADDIARLLEGCAGGDAAELVKCVEDAVRSLGPGLPHDDVAMLAVRVPAAGDGA